MAEQNERWHLKKEIQIGHLITTITVAAAAVMYVNKIEQRLAVVETQLTIQKERDMQQDKHLADSLMLIRTQLEKMDDKLTRLIERRSTQ